MTRMTSTATLNAYYVHLLPTQGDPVTTTIKPGLTTVAQGTLTVARVDGDPWGFRTARPVTLTVTRNFPWSPQRDLGPCPMMDCPLYRDDSAHPRPRHEGA